MANHKSSLKRIRQTETRRLRNRYYAKTMRNAVRKLRATTDKAEAQAMYPAVQKMLDKLAKTNNIHKYKAANLKSKLCANIAKLLENTLSKQIKYRAGNYIPALYYIYLNPNHSQLQENEQPQSLTRELR